MKSIACLFSAFGTLADSVLALASVIDGTTAKLQRQLEHESEPVASQVLEHEPVAIGNNSRRRK